MTTTAITPYLFFAGRCEEAISFYAEALGAQVEMMMRFSDSPDPTPEGMLQPGFENKVMHASMTIAGVRIMASDGCDDKTRFEGFRLAISIHSEADARRMFDALADGGKVDLPLCATFWSPCYGMVTDRFNVGWMVMVPGEAP